MANIIEIIIKAIDQASGVAEKANQKVTASNEAMAKSFEGVGIASDAVDKRLSDYGAALSDVARAQNQLKQAQFEAQEAANNLARAQQNLKENTDPSKLESLNKELVKSQVELDKAGKEVQTLSKNLREGKFEADNAGGGFSKMQAALVTANQAIDLIGRGFGIAKQVIDQTLGSTVAYAKEVRDLSTNLGITAEETSKVIQAADDYGISVETVTGALQMAVKRGFAPNIETLAKLADEYNSIKDPVERAARLTEVFGRNWTSLTPMLKAGGQAIREAADEAAKLGLVLNDKDVQAARALEIQIDNLNDRVEALKLKMGKDLVPAAINVADALDKFATVAGGTETPLEVMNRELQYLISLTGKDSDVTKAAEKAIADYSQRLDDAIQMTDGAERSQARAVATTEAYRKQLEQAQRNISDYADAGERATKRQDDFNASMERSKANARYITETTNLAINYTEAQKEQADVQKELDALNAKIAARGPVRVATVAAEVKATTDLTASQGALSAARAAADDIAKRDNESSAQYAMRLKDAQTNLKKLTEQMGSHIVTANALSATDQKSALNQAKLAAAQEDLATAQKKKGETDAEFVLRVETIKSKIAEYSKTLTTHTGIVGGATKAELEQKKALEEQIAAMQKAGETEKAKAGFEVLNKALSDGIINETQYTERTTALNAVTRLYTDSALKEAQAQELFLKSLADPNTENYRGQLFKNQEALDGIVVKTDAVTKSTDAATEAMKRAGVPVPIPEIKTPPVPIKLDTAAVKADIDAVMGVVDTGKAKIAEPVKVNLDTAPAITAAENMAKALDNAVNKPLVLASPTALIQPFLKAFDNFKPSLTAAIDTTQATKDFDAFYTGKIGTIPTEKKTTTILDTTIAEKNLSKIMGLYNTVPKTKETEVKIDTAAAQQQLDDILRSLSSITDKDATVTVHYKATGDRPEGFQRGIDMIVPPSPTGRSGDYFPFLAAPGERVTVQTPAQQAARQTAPLTQGGDTYNYTTNVYNPLAAAMLADKQRRDRLARSNARMGVT